MEMKLTTEWDKTFPLSDRVDHRKATFHNRYGITLAADLYQPKDAAEKLAAIAVCGPFGAVKEQAAGLYAQAMAERGFLAIAFDPSFTGESGGEPRYMASPDINTEDFQAAVDFLSVQENADPERIGIIGICGWGGMALNAAALDTRIKATVTSTMYDMCRVNAKGYFDAEDSDNARYEKRKALNAQRTADYRSGSYARNPGKDFTRKRTLTPAVWIYLILTMGEKSIWKGLLGHFQGRIDTPSAPAFVHQRQKLLPAVFEDLFRQFTDFLRPRKKFRGCRLLTVDGSSLKSGAYPADSEAYRPGTEHRHGWNLFHINATLSTSTCWSWKTNNLYTLSPLPSPPKMTVNATGRCGIASVLSTNRSITATSNSSNSWTLPLSGRGCGHGCRNCVRRRSRSR